MKNNNPFQQFDQVEDPRQQGKIRHPLDKIFLIVLGATLTGADDWESMEEFARSREHWLSTIVDMSTGIPSADTLARVFSLIDPEQFRVAFIDWVQNIIEFAEQDSGTLLPSVIAIDGKTLRRSHDRSAGKLPIHMVNAWCSQTNLILGQLKTNEKSNEITAVPELLKLIDIKGRLITADAMSCQKQIVKTCIDQGADYLLAVKNNQPTLLTEIDDHLGGRKPRAYKRPEIDFYSTDEFNRDRHEIRRCWVTPIGNKISKGEDWAGLTAIIRVESVRTHKGKESVEQKYYISSKHLSAEEALHASRSHWGVESMHWMLDVGFNEDDNRTRKGYSAENLAVMRHLTLNILKKDKTCKLGIKNKRLKAAYSQEYFELIIASISA